MLQVVSPKTQRPLSSGLSNVTSNNWLRTAFDYIWEVNSLMSSILDSHTDIVFLCELQCL